MALANEKCQPCRAGTPPLDETKVRQLAAQIPEWTAKEKSLERTFKFNDFYEAIEFVNRVAVQAQSQDHHPDIHIYYNKVTIELSTHKIGGLSLNDFILAAQIDGLLVNI